MSEIEGEIGQVIVLNESGSFAAEITVDGCTQITECIEIEDLSISAEELKMNYSIFPNPSSGEFTINFDAIMTDVSIVVFDLNGKQIMNFAAGNTDKVSIDLNAVPGFYTVQIESGNAFLSRTKIIKI